MPISTSPPLKRRHTRIAYRADIDGLRAVAVLAVVAFHLQSRFALGGFIGVDVFFVISGYLITSILATDLHSGRFSLREFYIRRIRRIYPALIAAMLGTTAFAFLLAMPSELRDYARSLIAASLSASNIFFGLHSTYFDPRSLSRPALQTWSLGVEDQFYLLFPPLLALVWKRARKHLRLVLGSVAALSFAVNVFEAYQQPALAFFMPWTRASELLLGSLIAVGAFPRVRSPRLRGAAAATGLLLVLASVLLLNGAMPLPGFAALAPCGGAALLLWSGRAEVDGHLPEPTGVARLLASRPLVFVGLISYSLYLWHWPVIVFQGLSTWGDTLPHREMKAILVAISFALAIASWRWIELPFRDGRLILRGRKAWVFAGAGSALLTGLGAIALALNGLPGRFPAAVVAVGNYVDAPLHYRMGTCMVLRARDYQTAPCLTESRTEPNWLLIGDSHAAAQWDGLARAFPGVQMLQVSLASCHPDPARTEGGCGALNQMVFDHWLPTHTIGRLIADARWTADDVGEIDRLVAWCRARGIPMTLIGPVPDYDAPLPRLLAYGMLRHDPGLAARHRIEETGAVDRLFAKLARTRWHIPYVSIFDLLCQGEHCQTYVNGPGSAPLLIDGDHLSDEGSILLGRRMAQEHLVQ